MTALLAMAAAPLLAIGSWIARPDVATCPQGWWLATGIRRDGSFSCHLRSPAGDWPPMDAPVETSLPGHIWCVSGAVALQDGVRVWCGGGVRA